MPANIPYSTPYPLDNCHPAHTLTPTDHMSAFSQSNQTCSTNPLYSSCVCVCEFSESKQLILSSGCVFRSKLQCCWSLSIIYNPVNSISVTTASAAPLQLCQAQFGSTFAMQDSSCSQVKSDYQHKRCSKKSGPWLPHSKHVKYEQFGAWAPAGVATDVWREWLHASQALLIWDVASTTNHFYHISYGFVAQPGNPF